MADERWVVAYEAADNMEAHLLQGLLEASEVQVRLTGEWLAGGVGELPADAAGVRLWVMASQVGLAHTVLDAYEAEDESHPWRCLECHEENGAAFERCWQCGAPKP